MQHLHPKSLDFARRWPGSSATTVSFVAATHWLVGQPRSHRPLGRSRAYPRATTSSASATRMRGAPPNRRGSTTTATCCVPAQARATCGSTSRLVPRPRASRKIAQNIGWATYFAGSQRLRPEMCTASEVMSPSVDTVRIRTAARWAVTGQPACGTRSSVYVHRHDRRSDRVAPSHRSFSPHRRGPVVSRFARAKQRATRAKQQVSVSVFDPAAGPFELVDPSRLDHQKFVAR